MWIPSEEASTRVLVVDRHPAICEALAGMIETSGPLALAGAASTADEAYTAVKIHHPDVVVLDLNLPDGDGIDVVHNLISMYPALKIVVYTAYREGVYAERALRAGVLAYVMKTEPTSVVEEAIQSVARGEVHLSAAMASRILIRSVGEQSGAPTSPTELLTDREVAVLQLLGEGADADKIAVQLHVSRKTVETHRRHIKEKLELDSVSALLVFAVRWVEA